jgi:hypothetical protein
VRGLVTGNNAQQQADVAKAIRTPADGAAARHASPAARRPRRSQDRAIAVTAVTAATAATARSRGERIPVTSAAPADGAAPEATVLVDLGRGRDGGGS